MSTVLSGKSYPLGAHWDGQGVNFALYSENAIRVELCLFDTPDAAHEQTRILLPEKTNNVWHTYLPGIQPGQLYGYRVDGPYNPEIGLRFNPAKLLIDPYARALNGTIRWDDAVYGYRVDDQFADLVLDERDSAPYVPRSVVIDPAFDWGDDCPPATPLHKSVVYELHVKGFTQLHPDIPENLRGTYAGLATPPVIDYLKSLGVTAVELLPIHQFVDDRFLVKQSLRNYWGYSTLAFFAPDVRYSSTGTQGEQVREFKAMVKALHVAGIEVLLDVVYNHTAEGHQLGPTLSLRGVDNQVYYWLTPETPRYYADYTGTGNSLNVLHMQPLQLIMDSLRYWVQEMHVDGFRFDLASTLTRGPNGIDHLSAFLAMVRQDSVISQVKLIAEPWDISPDGYLVGKFPAGWSEWNGKYRDATRRFWNGYDHQPVEFVYRLLGSPDLYAAAGRHPQASVNFVTSHDGFTLHDLVSYNQKHNEANGEDNRDGDNHNNSQNFGVEGPTDDSEINTIRAQQQRNLLATLFLSQGVPMILAGDERSRTQRGNNNAYCQDNEVSWVDWSLDAAQAELLAFVQHLSQIRQNHPVFQRRHFFQINNADGSETPDVTFWRPDGTAMPGHEWEQVGQPCIEILLSGQALNEQDSDGNNITDAPVLLLLNAQADTVTFSIPTVATVTAWETLVDTAHPQREQVTVRPEETYTLHGRSLALLKAASKRLNA